MTENKARYLLEKYEKQIDDGSMERFVTKLKQADDGVFDLMEHIVLKSIPVTVLLSVFLGGFSAGRFYIGDKSYAIKKLVGTIVLILLGNVMVMFSELSVLFTALSWICSLAVFLWNFIDIFYSLRAAKRLNGAFLLNRLENAIKEGAAI